MHETLTYAAGLVIILAAVWAYAWSSDALHPMVIIGPFLLYAYCYEPHSLMQSESLDFFLRYESDRDFVARVYFINVIALCLGLLFHRVRRGAAQVRNFTTGIDDKTRAQMLRVSMFMGGLALFSYCYGIYNVGGFVEAYSRPKGGGRSPYGWLNEMRLLSYPAVLMLGLALQNKVIRPVHYLLGLAFAFPSLMQATVGGRRGPMFIIASTLFFAWHIMHKKRPNVRTMAIGMGIISLAVLLVWSQRRHLYFGSEGNFDSTRITKTISTESATKGSAYIWGSGLILMCEHFNHHYWGRRIMVTMLIRPIPRQIWPTKYQDVGATWVTVENAGYMGFYDYEWINGVGWIPLSGSSAGIISDAYLEAKWGSVFICYLVGWFIGWLWKQGISRGGIWEMLFYVSLILIIYVPFQSLSAFYHRFLVMSILTIAIWHFFIDPLDFRPLQMRGSRSTRA